MNSFYHISRKYNQQLKFPLNEQCQGLYKNLRELRDEQQEVVGSYPITRLPEMKIKSKINDA